MESVAPSDSSQLGIPDNLESKEEQKIISMLKLNAESKEFDNDIENLENKIHSLNGYISSHNVEKTEKGFSGLSRLSLVHKTTSSNSTLEIKLTSTILDTNTFKENLPLAFKMLD